MSFFKRSFLSIIRKPFKTVLLLLIIFILGNVIAGSISIKQSLVNTKEAISETLTPSATIDMDYQNVPNDFNWETMKYITPEQFEKIGKLSSVKYYDYNTYYGVESTKYKEFVPEGLKDQFNYYKEGDSMYFTLYGVNYYKLTDIEAGTIKMVDGELFTEKDMTEGTKSVIISKPFAELNNLSVGSKITFTINIHSYGSGKEYSVKPLKTYKIEYLVIGLYDLVKYETPKNKDEEMNIYYQQMDALRKIYIPNKVIEGLLKEENDIRAENGEYYENKTYYSNTFMLKDYKSLLEFKKEATAFLPEYYRIYDSNDKIADAFTPLKTIEKISTIVLYSSIGATILILSLTITLFLRDRRHEIGIYLAMGERKYRVLSQILLETLVIAFAAIGLSLISGNIIAGKISSSMIEDNLLKPDIIYRDVYYYGGDDNITREEIIEKYDTKLNLKTTILFYSVGMGTVLLSTAIPLVYVLRLRPKKILM